MRLKVWPFALSCAILWGAGLFFLPWWVMAFQGKGGDVPLLSLVYRGYTLTPIGSLIGAAWGFFDALIAGALLAWIYNAMAGNYDKKVVPPTT